MLKKIITTILIGGMLMSTAVSAKTEERKFTGFSFDKTGKMFYVVNDERVKNQTLETKMGTFITDSNGDFKTGWIQVGDKWMFAAPNTCKIIKSGWWESFQDGKSYYFDEKGYMVTGQYTVNGNVYNFDVTDGHLVK
jgi:glucan-binding YG repeat protein